MDLTDATNLELYQELLLRSPTLGLPGKWRFDQLIAITPTAILNQTRPVPPGDGS